MKSGFSLIEILIAVALSSIVAWALFSSFNQAQKSSDLIEQMLSIDPKIMTLSNQLEKDINGVFVPKFWFPKEENKQSEAKQPEKKEEPKKDLNPKPGQRIPVKKEEYKKIDKVFFSVNEQSHLKEITFITCNPLQTYNNYKPRIARVLYKLVPDEENKNSYKLLRKESLNLDFSKINEEKNIEYELASGVKNLSLSFIYPEKEKDNKEEAKKTKNEKPEEPKELKYKTSETWNKEENKDIPDIPEYVVLKVSLWDLNLQEDYNFEIRYQIFAFSNEEDESSKKESELKTEDAKKESSDKGAKSQAQQKPVLASQSARPSALSANQRPGLGNLIR